MTVRRFGSLRWKVLNYLIVVWPVFQVFGGRPPAHILRRPNLRPQFNLAPCVQVWQRQDTKSADQILHPAGIVARADLPTRARFIGSIIHV